METFDDCHLSNPELRVHNLQMFGRTLGNWAHRLGPHTVGIKNIIKERDKAKDNYKLLYLSPPFLNIWRI